MFVKGDLVRINIKLYNPENRMPVGWCSEMSKYNGAEFVINNIEYEQDEDGREYPYQKYDYWNWDFRWLEKVRPYSILEDLYNNLCLQEK